MITETLIEADKFFFSFDLDMVAVYASKDDGCCISAKTDDDLLYLYVEDKDISLYKYQPCAIRSWKSMHTIIDTFNGKSGEMNVRVEADGENCPTILHFNSGRLKMKHYVQNYGMISKQDTLLDAFKRKKFKLGTTVVPNATELSIDIMREIAKFCIIMDTKFFRIKRQGGENYIYFGNENQSVDSCQINIGQIGGDQVWSDTSWFSAEYFGNLYRSLNGDNLRVRIEPNQIMLVSDSNNVIKVGAIRGKRI